MFDKCYPNLKIRLFRPKCRAFEIIITRNLRRAKSYSNYWPTTVK